MKAQRLIQLPVLEGEQAPSAKLTKSKAQAIKTALADGESPKALSAAHGVGYQTVYLIGIGSTWKSLEPKGRVLSKRGFITPKLRDKIFTWRREHGSSVVSAAEQFGVSKSAAARACRDGYAVFALRVHRAVLSSGTYEPVAKRFGIKRGEIDELMAFVSDGRIPARLKVEKC